MRPHNVAAMVAAQQGAILVVVERPWSSMGTTSRLFYERDVSTKKLCRMRMPPMLWCHHLCWSEQSVDGAQKLVFRKIINITKINYCK
jgi:hypothetical protein